MKNANLSHRTGSGTFALLSGMNRQMNAQFGSSLNFEKEHSARSANNVLNFLAMRSSIRAACYDAENLRPFSLLMVAIDELKELTEKYGAETAEQANSSVLSMLCHHRDLYFGPRNEVVIAEYVQGRFLVLLPKTTGLAGCEIAEYFRKSISENTFVSNSRQIRLTVCVGLVHKPGYDGDQDSMILQADRACAEAEHAGGDKVILARSTQPIY